MWWDLKVWLRRWCGEIPEKTRFAPGERGREAFVPLEKLKKYGTLEEDISELRCLSHELAKQLRMIPLIGQWLARRIEGK